jgi:hypothetical protein
VVAGVLAFRIVTFWLPIFPGWLAFRRLAKDVHRMTNAWTNRMAATTPSPLRELVTP